MRFSRSHQSHAATCRHASTRAIKAQFWNDLDCQYQDLLTAHSDLSIARFRAVQRARLRRVPDTLGVTLRTAASWLRAWPHNEVVSGGDEHQGDAQ